MKKISIWGYYGAGNIGDNMLLNIIVNQIKEIYPNSEITVVCVNFSLIQEELPIKKVKFQASSNNKVKYFLELVLFYMKLIKSNEIIIYGGGTQIFDNSKYSWRAIFPKAIVLLLNKLFYRKKILHYGIGIGTVNTQFGKFFTYLICKFSDFFIVRDIISYKKILSYNVPKNKVLLSRDLTYFFDFKSIPSVLKSKQLKIGFSLFDYYRHVEKDDEKSILMNRNIFDTLKYILDNTEYDIYLFAFQKKYGNQDEEYAKNLKKLLNSDKVKIIHYSNNWKKVLLSLEQMDICIGMRYHFLLLSLKMKIPIIALNYSIKVESELLMFGLQKYTVSIDELSVAKIIFLLDELIKDHSINSSIEKQLEIIRNDMKKTKIVFKKVICE